MNSRYEKIFNSNEVLFNFGFEKDDCYNDQYDKGVLL